MAARIPATLKAADLTRFLIRASQLETAKPVIAYWCEYWVVNQILSKGLHNGDPETLQYTTTLMDKLEQIKLENPTNDAIIDDTAGQAFVEHFALETFQRADRAVQANKVTKQTTDTFQAAATFLELSNIWGALNAESQAKIKYAKWNTVRILKTLKEGKDPNESNPKPQPMPEESLPALDPDDPEVQQLEQLDKLYQPSVEDVLDEQPLVEARTARQSSIDQSLHPSTQVSARASPSAASLAKFEPYPRDGFPYTEVQDDNVSPLEPSPNDRNGSVGGGYFPEVPTFTSEPSKPTLPTAPPDDTLDLGLPEQPPTVSGTDNPRAYDSVAPSITEQYPAPSPQDYYRGNPHPLNPHSPRQPTNYPPPLASTYQSNPPSQPLAQAPPAALNPGQSQLNNQRYNVDDIAIAKAQKHARWAISALNFEDSNTAVKELRAALQTLGAQ